MGIAIEVQLAEFDRLTMKLRAFALAVSRVHEGQSSIIHPGTFCRFGWHGRQGQFDHSQDQGTRTL